MPHGYPPDGVEQETRKDVKELFNHVAGTDKPLLTIFNPEDPEEFIL